MDRRSLLKILLFGIFSLFSKIKFGWPENRTGAPVIKTNKSSNDISKIVVVRHPMAMDEKGKARPSIVDDMLNSALVSFTKEDSPIKAWKQFFTSRDIVGIKVNSVNQRKGPCTQPALVNAIVRGLVSAGVVENNIIIWDKYEDQLIKAGFNINKSAKGVRCFGTNSRWRIFGKSLRFLQYELTSSRFGSIESHLSTILTKDCTAIINVPVLKDHKLAGITLSMKNFYGAIDNPSRYHKNNCSPYIADLNMLPEIRNKLRLIIGDGLRALYHGGPTGSPQWQWNYNGILLGTDPVAIDYVGWQIIEEKRKKEGLPSLKRERRQPNYINIAADSEHRLGINDPDRIAIENIQMK
jgi:uncharacterized protein (DUF362 family)